MGENRGREKQGERRKEKREGKTWGKIGEEINYSIKEIDNCKFKGTKTFD